MKVATNEEQTDEWRKTARCEQEASSSSAAASSDPTVALEYPASGETTKIGRGPYLCRSQVMLMTTYKFPRWMHSTRWTKESLHRRSVGMVSRRRCRRSQEK